jgi:RNA binding exosome subunit
VLAESITLKIFVNIDENSQEITDKFLKLVPFDLVKEKLLLNRKRVTGFNHEKIVILELKLKNKKHTTAFLEYFKTKLSDDLKLQLLNTLEERMDEECNFYIRLSKLELIYNDRYALTADGICLHIKIHVATYPKRRENALIEMRNYLSSYSVQ